MNSEVISFNMSQEAVSSQRVTPQQRRAMLDFMRDHPALAFNRFTAPDGAKHKMALLQEMSTILNSFPTGATKTSDKWLKSWQDWRSDTKAKASKIRRSRSVTGGGPHCKLVISQLEEELLELMGPVAVEGLTVLDPLLAENYVVHEEIVVDAAIGEMQDDDTPFGHLDDTPIIASRCHSSPPPCGTSNLPCPSSPPPKRKRTHIYSTESDKEERIINCSERSLQLQEQQVKLLQEQLKAQSEHYERMEAVVTKVADAVIEGLDSIKKCVDHFLKK